MSTDSAKLKQLREQFHLTQRALAEQLEVSLKLIVAIEGGDRNISMKLYKKIQEVFQTDIYNEKQSCDYSENIIALPLYPIAASAGSGNYLWDGIQPESLYFDRRFITNVLKLNPDNIHIIYAQGDSMDSGWNQPDDIKDGDLLFIDTTIKTGNNKIFVIQQDNTLRVKQLVKQGDTLIVKSKNVKYPDEIYTPDKIDTEISVIGEVVWHGK